MKLKTKENLLDTTLFFTMLSYSIIIWGYDRYGTYPYNKNPDTEPFGNYQIFWMNYKMPGNQENIVLVVAASLMWIRCILMLKLLPFIGPLMGIFKAMIKFIVAFLICFAIEVIFFALMGQLIL